MNLFSVDMEGVGKGVKDVAEGASGFLHSIRSLITGKVSPKDEAEIIKKSQELESKVVTLQSQVNNTEAQHSNWFIAGWRPAAGWMCVIGCSIHFILNPILFWIAAVSGWVIPTFEVQIYELTMLLGGMLGLGINRTIEKIKKAVGRH